MSTATMSTATIDFDDRVSVTLEGSVAEVRLSRERAHNAIDGRMFVALVAAADRLAGEASIRAVVLSGAGPSFCAGLDLKHFGPRLGSGEFADIRDRTHGDANLFQRVSLAWRDLPVPVIAALHGSVFGGGLQIALGADLRYCHPDARLSIMETRWGLVPDMGGIALLRGLVRDDAVRDLVYTARIVSAEEARDLGLVSRVCEAPREAALETARRIASQGPHAIRAAKRLIAGMYDQTRADILLQESEEQSPLLGGPDQVEAMTAQAAGRPPRFA